MLVKASAGGGGRGMRIVRAADELDDALADAEREAAAAFGDGTVFCERYVERGRHIEIQVFGDAPRHTCRRCPSGSARSSAVTRRSSRSRRRRPSTTTCGRRMADAAVAAARAVGYVGAGTVEFLLDPAGEFWFLEMNTRLQVEHPVTEAGHRPRPRRSSS